MSEFDWKAARRSLPFRGTASHAGSKLTARCPHCGSYRYHFYEGRFKRCTVCGYDRREESRFAHVRFLMVRGRGDEVPPETERLARTYYRLVYDNIREPRA